MLIEELSRQATLEVLASTRLGRLACAQGVQPYVVPFFFVYHHNYLYSFSTVGQKIEWMRANPLVCVEADEVVSPHRWVSVVIFGRYEELPDTPESELSAHSPGNYCKSTKCGGSPVTQRRSSTARSAR